MKCIYYCSIVIPEILKNPKDAIVRIGQSTKLLCNATGTDLDYQWIKDEVTTLDTISNMLKITEITESDEGVYKCVASNEGGMIESNPATITVFGE